jgi:hypothetical protein
MTREFLSGGGLVMTDAAGLESALHRLLMDKRLRASIGTNGLKVVQTHSGCADHYARIILEKIGQTTGQSGSAISGGNRGISRTTSRITTGHVQPVS